MLARVQQFGNFGQPLSVGLNDEEGGFGALRDVAGDVGDDGHDAAGWAEDVPGALERFSADGVEDEIDVAEMQVESGATVVDCLVGS